MKIAVIYEGLLGAAWSLSDGLTSTLKRMGHQVEEWPLGRPHSRPLHAEYLKLADLILASGLEHYANNPPGMVAGIPTKEWDAIKVPKVAWFHESFFRDDRSFDFTTIRPHADFFFFPAFQDAVMFAGLNFGASEVCHWLPAGVDTEVFKVVDGTNREIPAAFIGSFYPKRVAYLNSLLRHIKVPFMAGGGVAVNDIEGVNPLETVKRLAYNYSRIQVFLNLPAYSRLLVTKVYEAMACGCMMVTPSLSGTAEANMDPFQHAKHIVYYKETNLGFVNQILREYIEREDDRRLIAACGQQEIILNHTLEQRLEKLLRLSSSATPDEEKVKLVIP